MRPELAPPPPHPGDVLTILTAFSGTESLTSRIISRMNRSIYSNVLPSGPVMLARIKLRSSYGAVSLRTFTQIQAIREQQIATIGKLKHLSRQNHSTDLEKHV